MKNLHVFNSIFFYLFIQISNQAFAQVELQQPFRVIETPSGYALKNAKLSESTFLQQDEKVVSRIVNERPKTLFLKIPIDKANSVELYFERYDIVNQGTRIVQGTNSGDVGISGANQIVSYRGYTRDNPEAKSVISFTQQGTGGIVSTSSDNFIIETIANQKNVLRIRKETESDALQSIPCGVDEPNLPDPLKKMMSRIDLKSVSLSQNTDLLEVKVALEADYEFYQMFQENLDNAVFNLLNTIAVVSDIYEGDMNIRLVVSYLRVWTTTDDPYTGRYTGSLISQFQNYWNQNMTNVNRNLAFYVTSINGISGGALGMLGGINNTSTAYGLATGGSYALGRTFNGSDVYTIAHEIGHILGSPHTHSCFWSGGPIDFCDIVEGDCYNGPTISSIGTIMSYCAKSELKFHPLCSALIRSSVKAAPDIKVIDSIPLMPVLVTPLNKDSSVATSPVLNWNYASGANQYRIQISLNENFTNLIVNTTTEIIKFTLSDLKDNTTYYWRVRGENEFVEGGWSEKWKFTTSDGMILPPPVPCFPRDGAVAFGTPLIFRWHPSTGSTTYEIHVEDVNFGQQDFLYLTLNDTFYVADETLDRRCNERCSWSVRAINGSRKSKWSAPSSVWRAKTADPYFPSDYTMNLPSTLPLIWNYYRNATSSHLQISESKDFSNLLLDKPGIVPPTAFGYERPRIYMTSFENNKTYYWRVRNNYYDADSLAVSSEWKTSRFTTHQGLENVWNYYNSDNSGIKENIITEISIGNNGEIWSRPYNQGIAKFDGNKWSFYDYESTNGVVTNSMGGLFVDRVDNAVWVGGNPQGHPTIYRLKDNQWTIYNSTNAGLPDNGVWWVTKTVRDANGVMWFATLRGLIKFDGLNWTTYNSANSPLPSDYLESLLCEPNGTIWISTESAGLVKFDGLNWTIYNTQNSSLPSNRVFDMLYDNNNVLWLACEEGIAKISGTKWEIYNSTNLGLSIQYFYELALDKLGNVWVGGVGGVAKYNGIFWEKFLWGSSANPVWRTEALEIDDSGKIWIGGDGEGLVSYNPENHLPIAYAGSDQVINEGTTTTLDGSTSFDPDGNPLTYKWTVPAGIILSSTTIAEPTFTAPEVQKDSIFKFSLVVHDGSVDSKPASANITVLNVIKVGISDFNTPKFNIYPNPTTGIITLEFAKNSGKKAEVSVSNLIGVELFRKVLCCKSNYQVDLSNQVSGIYLIKVNFGNQDQVYNSKIVLRK